MITKILTTTSRYLLAFVFIFSGFVKGIDPLGFTYKLTDYFIAFNLDFFKPFALYFSVAACAAEMLIGLLLLFGVKMKTAAWGAFLFMAFFTPLTFVIAILNPVSDCGCFGDAIKLSNWGTFFKNIPLFLAAWLLLTQRKHFVKSISPAFETVIAFMLLIVSILPSANGYRHLPMIDFLPFSIGTNIPEAMSIPANAPADEYLTTLFYEKNGVVKEFNEQNFPWQDSTWKFVDTKSVLVKEGFKPPISDFTIENNEGSVVTDSIINFQGYFLLLVSQNLEKVNLELSKDFNPLCFKANEQGFGFACITASTLESIDKFVGQTGAAYPIFTADETVLKSVVRANPGLLLLYNGTIIGKWHYRDIPEVDYFDGNLVAKQTDKFRRKLQNQRALCFSLCIVLLLMAFSLVKRGRRS